MPVRIIGSATLARTVSMTEAIAAAREAFVALATGEAVVPVRAHVPVAGGMALFMPGYSRTLGFAGLKLVSVTPENPGRGLPVVQAAVLLMDDTTGTPVALLEGATLTRIRTGAAIGLGAELFALPGADTVALFGAGATARASLEAVCAVRPVRDVRVVHPHAERFPAFVAAMRAALGDRCPGLRRVETAAEALRGAQIVITATTSPEPLFSGSLIEPGAYAGALGAFTPETRELDTEAVLRARLIVDTRAGALAEAGEVVIPIREGRMTEAHIHAEIGEVAAGMRPGRQGAGIIIFKTTGNAMQDLTLAVRVYRRAEQLGLGTTAALGG